MAQQLQPSERNELEITDLCKLYLQKDQLTVEILSRGTAWLDAGTHESLLQAANYIYTIEERQGMMSSCPEEMAFRLGFIPREQLGKLADEYANTRYGDYLKNLARSG